LSYVPKTSVNRHYSFAARGSKGGELPPKSPLGQLPLWSQTSAKPALARGPGNRRHGEPRPEEQGPPRAAPAGARHRGERAFPCGRSS